MTRHRFRFGVVAAVARSGEEWADKARRMPSPSRFSPGCGKRSGRLEPFIVSRVDGSAESLVATMASLRVLFLDGEVIEGESDDVSSARLGFAMRPNVGNNRLAWVPFSALKYCKFSPAGAVRTVRPEDPRGQVGLPKLVLRFNDGEVMRGYKDEVFAHDGNCLNVMLWDQLTRSLCRYIVPYSALKAVFFVEQWDSREGVEATA